MTSKPSSQRHSAGDAAINRPKPGHAAQKKDR
jgi:hypothetical protein